MRAFTYFAVPFFSALGSGLAGTVDNPSAKQWISMVLLALAAGFTALRGYQATPADAPEARGTGVPPANQPPNTGPR